MTGHYIMSKSFTLFWIYIIHLNVLIISRLTLFLVILLSQIIIIPLFSQWFVLFSLFALFLFVLLTLFDFRCLQTIIITWTFLQKFLVRTFSLSILLYCFFYFLLLLNNFSFLFTCSFLFSFFKLY